MLSNNTTKAYIDIDFSNGGKVNPIREIIIGPKNCSSIINMESFPGNIKY